jgi:hypothetical protein
MKKAIVLIALFVMPIVIYLFFALASHNALFLPVINEKIPELPTWESTNGEQVKLKDKITILGFLGQNAESNKGNLLNLNQKIFNKFKDFKDFQLVMVCNLGTENQIEIIKKELSRYGEIGRWTFVYANPNEMETYFNQLEVKQKLIGNQGTPQVFIIDKEQKLRGRKGKNKKGEEEYKESYDTRSASEMHNELTDDFKIILREYRLALKKNDPNQRKKG